jgi:hypothetical protein
VSGTGVLAHSYGTRVADGFFHSFSGWVIYVTAALLLFATGWALDRVGRWGRAGRRNGQVKMFDQTNGTTNAVNAVSPV